MSLLLLTLQRTPMGHVRWPDGPDTTTIELVSDDAHSCLHLAGFFARIPGVMHVRLSLKLAETWEYNKHWGTT